MSLIPCFSNRPIFGFDDFLWPTHHHYRLGLRDSDDWMIMPVIPNMIRDQEDMILRSSSPGYEIHQTNGSYRISVDVPGGVKASDISVQVEEEGKVLHVSGMRQVENQDGIKSQTMKFSKRFTIGSNMDIDMMTANLSDGVLTLSAPVKEKTTPPVRTIAVTEGKMEE